MCIGFLPPAGSGGLSDHIPACTINWNHRLTGELDKAERFRMLEILNVIRRQRVSKRVAKLGVLGTD